MQSDGLLLLRKPPHVTSFKALGEIKRKVAPAKAGHTGTLDSFAEGLLVVLCGRMTRLAPQVSGMDKEYCAVIAFGAETSTLDPEGEIVAEGPVPDIEMIRDHLTAFLGEIVQVPPAYSAVHIGGRRAYQAARAGEVPLLEPRPVQIYDLSVEGYSAPYLRLRVRCAKGTYIRSLARDLGRSCNSRAHVRELVRTRVGPFNVSDAVSAEEFEPKRHLLGWREALRALGGIAEGELRPEWERRLGAGVPLGPDSFATLTAEEGKVAVFSTDGRFLALAERSGGRFTYEFVAADSGR
ncbi:MAG TPA: tRNA pseudouridine(55) synthase TruB [Spirochaetia bacterium]|nr:tRNA pseudouridine(55) synthase TruB [Spirochaetia bacterium]